MKSYMTVSFSSEGRKPSEIIDRLTQFGFKPIHGNYDLIYEWDKTSTLEEAIGLADKAHGLLEGYKVLCKFETI